MSARDGILIVDDDDDLRAMIELVLRDAGYATRTALDGSHALEAVATSMPALILLDMLMPVMDGAQFVQEFRARYGSEVPIVVVTAAEHARHRASATDAADVLAKPFAVGDLLRVVARHITPPPPR